MTDSVRHGTVAVLVALSLFAVSERAECARQAPPAQAPAVRQAPAPPATVSPVTRRGVAPEAVPVNAEQTRKALRSVLAYYSPSVGRVLALDPQLLQNAAYLEPYPELTVFLEQHPEVIRNAAYYFGEFRPDFYVPLDKDTQALRMWGSLFTTMAVFLAFAFVTGVLVWLIKTLVDYRRWSRLSKVQTEAHNKLLDRFTANDELLAYIATPSGKRFLESAPIMLDQSSASIGAPLKRILWATEIGVVTVCVGIGGFLAQHNLEAEISRMLFFISVLVVSLGVGFVLAAVASYLLSRRLGVLGGAASRQPGDADAQPGA